MRAGRFFFFTANLEGFTFHKNNAYFQYHFSMLHIARGSELSELSEALKSRNSKTFLNTLPVFNFQYFRGGEAPYIAASCAQRSICNDINPLHLEINLAGYLRFLF